MARTLRFSSLFLFAASWMLAAGCGDDDAIVFPAGSSGQAGAGAHAGSSGSGAHAGATGGAGKAGSNAAGSSAAGSSEAGGSGADTGGAAGEGGAAPSSGGTSGGGTSGGGTSGGGGATAGTGGTSGGGGGTAGTGGTAGGGGADNGALKKCAYQCNTDDDCRVSGQATTHFCNQTSKRCEDFSLCQTQSDCVAFGSLWNQLCNDDSGCDPFWSCVAFGGHGVCAPTVDPDYGCALAANADSVPTTVARVGTAGTIDVCASSDGVCVGNACQFSCASDNGSCTQGTTCNIGTGQCECSASSQCAALATPGKPECGADSHCGCATSAECAGTSASKGADKCYSGTCGCSNTSACPVQFNNAPPVCE